MATDSLITHPAFNIEPEKVFMSKNDPELPLYLELINKTKTKIYRIADLDVNIPKLGIKGNVKAYLALLDYPVARYAHVVSADNMVAFGFTNNIRVALKKLGELLVKAENMLSRMVEDRLMKEAVVPKVQKIYEEITPLIGKLVEPIHKKTGLDYMYLFEAIADVVKHEMMQQELANVVQKHPEFMEPLNRILGVARKIKELYTYEKYTGGILNRLGSEFKNVKEIKI